jgi:hypothetical protein
MLLLELVFTLSLESHKSIDVEILYSYCNFTKYSPYCPQTRRWSRASSESCRSHVMYRPEMNEITECPRSTLTLKAVYDIVVQAFGDCLHKRRNRK